jgi:16S rRNA (uracil1498-N3)-methyltransferase
VRRFFVEPGTLDSDEIIIDGALAHRLARVLRLRSGGEVALFDGTGIEVRASLTNIDDRACTASAVERYDAPAEPAVKLHLYQSITKGERFEWLVEKGTEIGASRFVPLITSRAVVKTAGEGSRLDRWRRIAVEAAEQCGRGAVPVVEAPQLFAQALASAPGLLLLPYEAANESTLDVKSALDAEIDALFALSAVSVFVGPEGGYEADEVRQAQEAGAIVVTMGRRVLRSETAGLVAATLVMQAVGELG